MEKLLTISLFNNSKKLVQILLKFSQQITEGYEFVLAKFCWKRSFQSTNIFDLSQNKGWSFLAVFYVYVQNAIEVSCANFLDVTDCCSLWGLKTITSLGRQDLVTQFFFITFLYKLVAKKLDFVLSKLQISIWKDRATVTW